MAIINISQLGGFLVNMWIDIIKWLASSIPNYAWAIVILTIAIKLFMSPLDYFNKKVSRKNAKMQAVVQPQLEKAKSQYANDSALYNQKMNEIYRANNYNVMGSCLFMLVNLALTLVIFISLLNGMNAMASERISNQYTTLQQTYETTIQANQEKAEEQQIELANQEVVIKYNEIKDSWLWIKNVWKSDTLTNSIPTFEEYLNVAKTIEFEGENYNTKTLKKSLTEEQVTTIKLEYEKIMTPLREKEGKANGLFLLVILVVATSILSQWLSQRKLKQNSKGKEDTTQSMNKTMMVMLPVLFGFFALSSTSMFSLYLVTSQIIAILTTPLIDFIIDKNQDREDVKRVAKNTPSYSRDNVKAVYEKKEVISKPEKKDNKGENK
jgi:YidC/Oxa1 family membrane protein insertase